MSAGVSYPYEEMIRVAKMVQEALGPFCERVEVAGSLRRKCGRVGDVELVAISKPSEQMDLFGNLVSRGAMVVENLHQAMPFRFHRVKGGDERDWRDKARYVQLMMAVDIYDGPARAINLDLFLVAPPAQWGVIYAIRTGGAGFSRWLVTSRKAGGACPEGYCIMDGGLHRVGAPGMASWELVETAEEEDFFRALGVNWVAPEEREGDLDEFRKFLGTRGRNNLTPRSEEPSGPFPRREGAPGMAAPGAAVKDVLPYSAG